MKYWCWKAASVVLGIVTASPVAAQIIAPGATVQLLDTFVDGTFNNFTESPLYDGNGGVYVSDMWPLATQATRPSRIYRYDLATDTKTLVDSNSGTANGTIFNPFGNLISADRDRRQISLRSAANVAVVDTVLTSNYLGTSYNGPNDLIQDAAGGIYFTDPDYEGRLALPDALYYRSGAGTVSRLRTYASPNHRPNGVVLSPNGSVLYVALWNNRRIMAYDVAADGSLSGDREFAVTNTLIGGGAHNGRPDGMTIDAAGNLFASVGNRVFVWDSAGTRLADILIPSGSTNVDIGGAGGHTLFITAGKSLYSVLLIPEPSSLVLALVACLALARRRVRR